MAEPSVAQMPSSLPCCLAPPSNFQTVTWKCPLPSAAQHNANSLRCVPLLVHRSTWLMAWPRLVNTRLDPSLGHNNNNNNNSAAAASSRPGTKATAAASSGCLSHPTTSRCRHTLHRCKKPALIGSSGRCCRSVRVSQVVPNRPCCHYFIRRTTSPVEYVAAADNAPHSRIFPRWRRFFCS